MTANVFGFEQDGLFVNTSLIAVRAGMSVFSACCARRAMARGMLIHAKTVLARRALCWLI